MKRRSKHHVMDRPLTAELVKNTLRRAKRHALTPKSPRLQQELLLLHNRISKVVEKMPPQEGFQFLIKSGIYTAEEGFDSLYFEVLRTAARSKKSK